MTPNPVRMTEAAALKLPRWGLLVLLIAYAVPGLFGRDPWRADDAVGFGIMWTMAHGNLHDWLIPNVAGAVYVDDGPLFFWVGATFVKLLGAWMPAHEVARLATLCALWLASWSIWHAAYLIARRPEAQPQQFAFGGQPSARNFGRALADGAVLITVATLGLLMRAHETSAEIPQFALLCLAMYALARSLEHPSRGALWLGASIAGLALVHNLAVAVIPVAMASLLYIGTPEWRALGLKWLGLALASALLPGLIWVAAAGSQSAGREFLGAWWQAQALQPWVFNPSTWWYYLRNLPWFTWPAWPLAAWAAWTWRGHRRSAQFTLPAAGLIAAAWYLAFGEPNSDTAMIAVVPPLVMLGALALPALRRGTANLIDWFALMIFTVLAGLVWLGWAALMTGVPAQLAANAAKIAPGFVPSFDALGFALAVAVTLAWAWLVRWRISARPDVLWRSVVLSAGGITIVWALLMCLLLPFADYLKTYRGVSAQIARQVPSGACVRAQPLGLSQRASLAYFDGLVFADQCDWLLRHQNAGQSIPALDPNHWERVWEGRRATDRHERFTLYRRRPGADGDLHADSPATGVHTTGDAVAAGAQDARPVP